MKNITKVGRLSGLAFENGIRLHKDSMLLYRNESFPSALALSILAQEEIGKAFMLQEHCFQMDFREEDITPEMESILAKAIVSHRSKQGWFLYEVGDHWNYRKKKPRGFMADIINGKLDEIKQNAIYVGLERANKKATLDGKILKPSKINITYANRHITRVNDFIIDLAEGCRRGIYGIDSPSMDKCLTLELVSELEGLWPDKTYQSKVRLKRVRRLPLDEE